MSAADAAPATTAVGGVPSTTSRLRAFGAFVIRRTGWRSALALTFLVLASLTEGVSVLMLAPVLRVVTEGDGRLDLPLPGGGEASFGLAAVLAGLCALVALRAVFMRCKDVYMMGLLYALTNDMRIGLFRSIGRARWRLLASLRGSDIDHALTADIDRIQVGTYQLLMLVQAAVMLAVYAAVSLAVSPAMTAVAAAIGLVGLVVMRPIRKHAAEYGSRLTEQRQQQYRAVSEFVAGVKVAKSLGAEPAYVAKLSRTLEAIAASSLTYTRITSLGAAAFQILTVCGLALFVHTAVTERHMSFSALAVLIVVFMRVAPRFMDLQTYLQGVLSSLGAFEAMHRLQALCDSDSEASDEAQALAPPLLRSLRFEGVAFRYPGAAAPVLRDIAFELPAGSIAAVIGASGSGKSTLADLMLGLLEPAEGRILIDGAPLSFANRRSWRDRVAYVPQDVFLLHDTVAENLRLAAPGASQDALWEALRLARADDFVRRLPLGLETEVGDRGLRLSGGERQRIALARALLRQPSLLILDEATSALDWENQSAIAEAIQGLRGRMTIVTIAHRPSMIAFADHVLAIEDGRLVESGAYADMLARPRSRLGALIAGERRHG